MNDTQLFNLKYALRLARSLPISELEEETVSEVKEIISNLEECITEETEKFEREMKKMADYFDIEVNPMGVEVGAVTDFIKKHNF